VILRKGQPKRNQIPSDAERGTIVIALNVDEEHDEVHYSNVAFRSDAGELLSEAIETLVACRNALARVRSPNALGPRFAPPQAGVGTKRQRSPPTTKFPSGDM
jgi:hypothetical protein